MDGIEFWRNTAREPLKSFTQSAEFISRELKREVDILTPAVREELRKNLQVALKYKV